MVIKMQDKSGGPATHRQKKKLQEFEVNPEVLFKEQNREKSRRIYWSGRGRGLNVTNVLHQEFGERVWSIGQTVIKSDKES